MKKLLLSALALIMAFTSSGINAFASEMNLKYESIPHIVIDAHGMTMEELQASMPQTRGATDEYYSLKRIYNEEPVFKGETVDKWSKWSEKGSNVVSTSIAVVLCGHPALMATNLYAWNDQMIEIKESKIYTREDTYYYYLADADYEIKDV